MGAPQYMPTMINQSAVQEPVSGTALPVGGQPKVQGQLDEATIKKILGTKISPTQALAERQLDLADQMRADAVKNVSGRQAGRAFVGPSNGAAIGSALQAAISGYMGMKGEQGMADAAAAQEASSLANFGEARKIRPYGWGQQ